jgi:hypothetical protein
VRFGYQSRKYVGDKSVKGRKFAPEVNSLIPVKYDADFLGMAEHLMHTDKIFKMVDI